MAANPEDKIGLAVCIHNDGFEVSLERRKLYEIVDDPLAAKDGLLRIIDESGDDYLYPATFFMRVQLPEPIAQAVIEAA